MSRIERLVNLELALQMGVSSLPRGPRPDGMYVHVYMEVPYYICNMTTEVDC